MVSDIQEHLASHFEVVGNSAVRCTLCPRLCQIKEGILGFCRVRKNIEGKLYALSYGKAVAVNIDPIEKKPLYHFHPGEKVFSFGTVGCTMRCKHCQNFDLSQSGAGELAEHDLSPDRIVELAIANGCRIIASTYNEPFVFFEYMLDTAKLAKKKGIKTVLVSNGFVEQNPLKEALPFIDAVNFDLKGITQKFYGSVTASFLKPVQEAIITVAKSKTHLELTNLIIPTLNDSEGDIARLCDWVKQNVGVDVPLHFSAFFPHFKLDHLPPTPKKTLLMAYKIAKKKGIRHVYLGNVQTDVGRDTVCSVCGKNLVRRDGYQIMTKNVKSGRCLGCEAIIVGEF